MSDETIKIRYTGIFDEAWLPDFGRDVKRGEAFDCPAELAESYLAQLGNFERVGGPAKKTDDEEN